MSVPAFFPYAQAQKLEVTGTCTLPAACITDAMVAGPLGVTKMEHQYQRGLAQPYASFCVDEKKSVHLVYGATGITITCRAKMPVACTAGSTCAVKFYKNNTIVATITFTDADAANAVKTQAASDTALVAGDDLEIEIDVTGGTPGKGVIATFVLKETAS